MLLRLQMVNELESEQLGRVAEEHELGFERLGRVVVVVDELGFEPRGQVVVLVCGTLAVQLEERGQEREQGQEQEQGRVVVLS